MHVTIPAVAFFASALLAGVVARLLWPRRAMPGARPLALLMLAALEWAVTAGFEAAALEPAAKVLLSKVAYLGIVSVPVLYLLFALEYTDPDREIGRRFVVSLWVVPLVALALVATNEAHGLIWSAIEPRPGSILLAYRHGIGYFALVAYLYGLLLAATVLLGRAAIRLRHPFRRQALAVLLGVPLPWAANILYVLGASPVPALDLAPAAFALTGLSLTLGVYRLGLFDIVPVAREAVVESMNDGVVVLDVLYRVVVANPSALALLGDAAGLKAGSVAGAELLAWVEPARRDAIEVGTLAFVERTGRNLEVRAVPLRDRRQSLTGWLVVLHDVTDATRAERELSAARVALADRVRELEAALSQIKTLQGLLPICSYCKRIRDDHNYWQQLEGYISRHSDARFSHSICPECYAREVKPQLEALAAARTSSADEG
jgi:PAS domain-containing protein